MKNQIEIISDQENIALSYIIRSSFLPEKTTFITPPEYKQQVGYIVYPKGGEVTQHTHKPIKRQLIGTSEVLLIKSGRCLMDIYNDDHKLIATRELYTGDLMIMVGGGHGFRMLEETVLLEIKQGPYIGLDEKERF